MVERQYAAQPQPIAAAEMAGAEDDKRGRKGSAYEYKRVPNLIAEATRAREPRREMRYQSGDTLILPAGHVHQIFADTESEFVSAMPMGGTVRLADGAVIDLPRRR